MTDLAWLRNRLYSVVLATPLVAACHGKGRSDLPVEAPASLADAGRVGVIENDVGPPDAAPPLDAFQYPSTPLHELLGFDVPDCNQMSWCTTLDVAESYREGRDSVAGCPSQLEDDYYFVEIDDSTRKQTR